MAAVPFLKLPVAILYIDTTGDTASLRGVYYRTALLVCQVVANSAFDRHISVDRLWQTPVDITLEVLEKDEYKYYFIINNNCRYCFPSLQCPLHRPLVVLGLIC
jgi:hypothetical protein